MEVGLAGRLGAGPSTDVGSGASQMGLTSLADGAATLPAICETAFARDVEERVAAIGAAATTQTATTAVATLRERVRRTDSDPHSTQSHRHDLW